MSKYLRTIVCFMAVVMVLCCIPVNALTDVTSVAKKDTLKILAIGNSFSEDATEYIPMIAKDCGVKNIIVGNMYIGGCTIEQHAENARNNKAAYKYYKNTSFSLMSVCPTTQNVSLETALTDEDWDIVTLQNSSVHSGQESKYKSDLTYMIDYVKEKCPNAKLGWHMTWAYETGYTGSAFATHYKKDEEYMYKSIVRCVKTYIEPNEKIDFIIPSGTAIQNARTSYLGDKLTRDGLHLTLDYGRYIVAALWMKSLGFSLDNLKTMPSRMRTRVLPFIRECVDNAMNTPYEVTQSVHWYEPGTTPPATQPVTEAETSKITESVESITEILEETKTPETVDNADIMPGKSNTGLVIVICCVAVAVVAVAVILIIAKKKKK
ncbi:MAG: DUF4886 domain-containing protein [Clostridia bacterium]|nr:DUF4886 domain-containing protein [Clostridia bacterium]